MSEGEDKYLSPSKAVRSSFNEQGSRFIADLAPVGSVQEAKALIGLVKAKFPDATHHTYVYRIGSGSALIEQASDDREPVGSAGTPMLRYLKGMNISDAVLVATRYFGGTKLGIGGLTRAYRHCARIACAEAHLELKEPLVKYTLQFKYEELGAVTRLAESLGGRIFNIVYQNVVILSLEIPTRTSAPFRERFRAVCRGCGKLELY